MNNTIRNIIFVSTAASLLAACATSKVIEKKEIAQPEPTYNEKVESKAMDSLKLASCPTDNKWESMEWKKITALANACVKARDWNRVEKMGDHLAIHAHLTPWGAYYLSLAAEGRKDMFRAIWMLELALKKAPKEGLFHYELGRINWEMGEDHAAIKHMKLASDLNSNLTDAHWIMGQMAMQRQNNGEAEGYFLKALKANAKHMPALLSMASLKLEAKDYNKAEEYLNEAISVNPRSSKARLALAQVQEGHLKKMQEALDNYKQLKQMSAEKKLDDGVPMNLDEKIKDLEQSLTTQAGKAKGGKLTVRTPSGERQVKK